MRWETLPDDLRSLVGRRDPTPVILEDDARAGITEVFDLHARGMSAGDIASTLNGSGRAARRGGSWTVDSVRHMLARRYEGVPASLEYTSRSQGTREDRVRDWSPEELVEAVHRLVWPHELDLVGVIVLLGLRTGLPPECIKVLRRPDLSEPKRALLGAELAEVDRTLSGIPTEEPDAER